MVKTNGDPPTHDQARPTQFPEGGSEVTKAWRKARAHAKTYSVMQATTARVTATISGNNVAAGFERHVYHTNKLTAREQGADADDVIHLGGTRSFLICHPLRFQAQADRTRRSRRRWRGTGGVA